jgi:hypothetical protein
MEMKVWQEEVPLVEVGVPCSLDTTSLQVEVEELAFSKSSICLLALLLLAATLAAQIWQLLRVLTSYNWALLLLQKEERQPLPA